MENKFLIILKVILLGSKILLILMEQLILSKILQMERILLLKIM